MALFYYVFVDHPIAYQILTGAYLEKVFFISSFY